MALTNGDFETGDLTGWALKAFSDPTLFTETVDATAKRSGSYGWHSNGVIASGNNQYSDISRYQVIDLTGMTTVSVWINFSGTHAGDGIAYLDVYVYDVGETLPPLSIGTGDNGFTSGWARLDIDVTGYYAGNCEIQIRKVVANTTGGTVNAQFYVDDIVCNALPPAPTASFTADVTSGDPPLTVQFTDTSTGTPTSWSWDFDDGSDPSTEQNPEHEFTSPGTYHVVLTATNAGGSDASDATTITVGIAPVASFTYVRAGNVITFTDTSTHAPTSWSWDFDDGSLPASDQNPVHYFPSSGGASYTITLTATNTTGSDSDSVVIDLTTAILSDSIISTSVSKGINDLMWICKQEIDGHPSINSRNIEVILPDHLGTDQLVFMGYIPGPAYRTQEAGHKTTVTAYSYFWYLTKQYLEALETDFTGQQQTFFYNDTAGTVTPLIDLYQATPIYAGEFYYLDITKYVTALLGGVSSVAKTGLTIHSVIDCDDWDDGTLKNKPFDFTRDDITKMDALQEIRDYIGYLFFEFFYKSTTNLDYAIWAPGNASDDVLHLPAMVTFEYPDPYVVGEIYGDDRSGEKYNRVRVRCNPGILIETFTATATTDSFVLSQHGRADSCSATVQHGVGGSIEDWPITEHLSSGEVDWVTATGLTLTPADLVTVTYFPVEKYYEKVRETSGVTAGTERAIEAPPIYDHDGSLGLRTQDDVDNFSLDYFNLCQTDPSVYHVVLEKRTDLRLMQRVKFIGFDKIPNAEMRIIYIQYSKGPGGIFVDIQCTLDRVLTLKRAINDYTLVSDVNLVERIVDKKLKETNSEKTTTGYLAYVGANSAIAKTDNGIFVMKENI